MRRYKLTRLWNVSSQLLGVCRQRDEHGEVLVWRDGVTCHAESQAQPLLPPFLSPPYLLFPLCLPFDVGPQRRACFVSSCRAVLRSRRTERIHETDLCCGPYSQPSLRCTADNLSQQQGGNKLNFILKSLNTARVSQPALMFCKQHSGYYPLSNKRICPLEIRTSLLPVCVCGAFFHLFFILTTNFHSSSDETASAYPDVFRKYSWRYIFNQEKEVLHVLSKKYSQKIMWDSCCR